MQPRIDYLKNGRGVFEAMYGLEKYLAQSGLDPKLMTLIKLRASQINGCAYCIDMHWKDLRAAGEANNGSMAWMPGENLPITRSGSAPLSPGRRRSQISSKVMPAKSLRKHASISRKRNSPI